MANLEQQNKKSQKQDLFTVGYSSMVDLALQILFWLKGLQFEHQDLCIDISKVTHNLVFNLGWAL